MTQQFITAKISGCA